MDLEENSDKWKQYFNEGCDVSAHHVEVSDGSKILIVKSNPPSQHELINCKPIILIPGWFSNAMGWIGTLKEISKCTQVIYFETREKSSSKLVKDADFSIRHDLWDIRKALLEDETRAYRPKCAYTYCTHMSAVDNEFCEESTCPEML